MIASDEDGLKVLASICCSLGMGAPTACLKELELRNRHLNHLRESWMAPLEKLAQAGDIWLNVDRDGDNMSVYEWDGTPRAFFDQDGAYTQRREPGKPADWAGCDLTDVISAAEQLARENWDRGLLYEREQELLALPSSLECGLGDSRLSRR